MSQFKILPIEGGVCVVDGVFTDGVNMGLKKDGTPDLGFLYFPKGVKVWYRLTTNKFRAAPLKHLLRRGVKETNFVVANSKNANAMTGEAGVKDIDYLLEKLEEIVGVKLHNPISSSTGLIGVRLPKDKFIAGFKKFDLTQRNSKNFSRAIMTTDTFPKDMAVEVEGSKGKFRIGGVAKGAGMIAPAMATMLAFIVTDAKLPDDEMDKILGEVVEETFNSISVDGDMSTNDSVFLFSTGEKEADREAFREGLRQVMLKLALDIVRDGEGATKLVAYKVKGAKNREEARRVGQTLANSLLVKTAIFGEDPNWGRIGASIGASRVEADESKLTIKIGDVTLYRHGEILMDAETEKRAHQVMTQDSFSIEVDLGIGDGEWTTYGCDLSYEYVKINAEYRT
jgi:glutamate N-acetyltransferase/amino-acid N-acetyltransferase